MQRCGISVLLSYSPLSYRWFPTLRTAGANRRDWFVLHSGNGRAWYAQPMENVGTMKCFTGSSLGESHAHLLQSYETKLSRVQNKSLNSSVALLIGWQKITSSLRLGASCCTRHFLECFIHSLGILSRGSDSWAQIPVRLAFFTLGCVLPASNIHWIFLSE